MTFLFIFSVLLGKNLIHVNAIEYQFSRSVYDDLDSLFCVAETDAAFLQKSNATEPIFYLAENGVTIQCSNCIAGDTGRVNGILYEAVDRDLLIQRRDEGADLSKVCTSLVSDMSFLFDNASSFNQDISSWDVSNVTCVAAMFRGASSFNQKIGGWDISNVSSLNGMFEGAILFNQYIGNWDVSNVMAMSCMFKNAVSFNQDIGSWNVGNVIEMDSLFAGASSFNQNIGSWDVSNVMAMAAMFFEASLFNQDLSSWNVNGVFDMYVMFYASGLSTENYSKILIGWASQSLQKSVYLDAGNIKYDISAEESRQYIIDTYEWTIVDGGLDTTSYLNTDSTTTVINEVNTNNNFLIYPNPTNNKLFIETSLSGEVRIFDLNGKMVLNQQIKNAKNELDVSELIIGTYFLRFEFNDGVRTLQFIKN